MNDIDKTKMAISYFENQACLDVLCGAMDSPLRVNFNFRCMVNRLFIIDPLGDRTPEYDLTDFFEGNENPIASYCINEDGESKTFVIEKDVNFIVPTFPLSVDCIIDLEDVKSSGFNGFNVLDRVISSLQKDIEKKEMHCFLSCIEALAKGSDNKFVVNRSGALSKRALVDLKIVIDGPKGITASFLMNKNQIQDMKLWEDADLIDWRTRQYEMDSGHYGMIFGVNIFVSDFVCPGDVYSFVDPEFLGVKPIKKEYSICAKKIEDTKYKFTATGEFGMCISNNLGVGISKIK
jgi:hypothetical protein